MKSEPFFYMLHLRQQQTRISSLQHENKIPNILFQQIGSDMLFTYK